MGREFCEYFCSETKNPCQQALKEVKTVSDVVVTSINQLLSYSPLDTTNKIYCIHPNAHIHPRIPPSIWVDALVTWVLCIQNHPMDQISDMVGIDVKIQFKNLFSFFTEYGC